MHEAALAVASGGLINRVAAILTTTTYIHLFVTNFETEVVTEFCSNYTIYTYYTN